MVIYDDLKYGTLCGNLSKNMIYYDGLFLVCSKSGSIYGQINESTVLIYHVLSLKLSLKNIPWALIYPILCHTSFIFKSELNPKLPIQIQTQVYLQALRSLCTIAANSFFESQAISYFCLHAISSLNTNPGPISNPTIPPTPSFLLQPTFYLPYICSCSLIPLCLPILHIYLHIAWISASTIICTAKQIYSREAQKDLSSTYLRTVWLKVVLALWADLNNSINCLLI